MLNVGCCAALLYPSSRSRKRAQRGAGARRSLRGWSNEESERSEQSGGEGGGDFAAVDAAAAGGSEAGGSAEAAAAGARSR